MSNMYEAVAHGPLVRSASEVSAFRVSIVLQVSWQRRRLREQLGVCVTCWVLAHGRVGCVFLSFIYVQMWL